LTFIIGLLCDDLLAFVVEAEATTAA